MSITCDCRLCLGAWSEHGERTGGFYACNRYEAAKQEGAVMPNRKANLFSSECNGVDFLSLYFLIY